MKTLAIIHGRAPMRDAVIDVINRWTYTHPDHHVTSFVTTARSSAGEALAAAQEYDNVISAGGDGTNNEVINGLMEISNEERPSLCVMPLGSGNDFARMLPERSPLQCFEAMGNEEKLRQIDVLRITAGRRVHYALNMITCGIGAEIAATVNHRKYNLPPAFNYYSAIIQWLLRYKAPEITFTIDGKERTSTTLLGAFGNGTYAGNGLGLNPQSVFDDGLMGATLIGNVGVIDFLRYQSTLKAANYVEDDRLEYTSARSVQLSVKDGECAIETDGEPFAKLEAGDTARIDILPHAITLI